MYSQEVSSQQAPVVQPGPCPIPEWQAPDFNETSAYWSKKLGFTPEQLNCVERLIISQGSSDMISGVGQPLLTSSSSRNHSRVMYAEGMAHGENMLSYSMVPRGSKHVVDEVSLRLSLGDTRSLAITRDNQMLLLTKLS